MTSGLALTSTESTPTNLSTGRRDVASETSSLLQNNLTLTPVVFLAICLSDSLLTCCETELSLLIHFPFDSATWELFQSPCLCILGSVFRKET